MIREGCRCQAPHWANPSPAIVYLGALVTVPILTGGLVNAHHPKRLRPLDKHALLASAPAVVLYPPVRPMTDAARLANYEVRCVEIRLERSVFTRITSLVLH